MNLDLYTSNERHWCSESTKRITWAKREIMKAWMPVILWRIPRIMLPNFEWERHWHWEGRFLVLPWTKSNGQKSNEEFFTCRDLRAIAFIVEKTLTPGNKASGLKKIVVENQPRLSVADRTWCLQRRSKNSLIKYSGRSHCLHYSAWRDKLGTDEEFWNPHQIWEKLGCISVISGLMLVIGHTNYCTCKSSIKRLHKNTVWRRSSSKSSRTLFIIPSWQRQSGSRGSHSSDKNTLPEQTQIKNVDDDVNIALSVTVVELTAIALQLARARNMGNSK